jgi:hypothetical protein
MSKTGRSKRAIGKPARDLLQSLPRLADEWVFPNRSDTGRADLKQFSPRCSTRQGRGTRAHLTRGAPFGSIAANEGYGDATIAELLGHSRRGVTQPLHPPARPGARGCGRSRFGAHRRHPEGERAGAEVVPLRPGASYCVEMTVAFDTLKLADRLEAAGMPPQQAKGVAAALAKTATANLVTREHLDLRCGEMEARLRGEIAAVRTEIAGLRAELLRWMIAQTFVILGAVAALIRLLH